MVMTDANLAPAMLNGVGLYRGELRASSTILSDGQKYEVLVLFTMETINDIQ